MLSQEHLQRLREERAKEEACQARLTIDRAEHVARLQGRNDENARHIKLLEAPPLDNCYLLGKRPDHSSHMVRFTGGFSHYLERRAYNPKTVIFEAERKAISFRLLDREAGPFNVYTVYWYDWKLVHQDGGVI